MNPKGTRWLNLLDVVLAEPWTPIKVEQQKTADRLWAADEGEGA